MMQLAEAMLEFFVATAEWLAEDKGDGGNGDDDAIRRYADSLNEARRPPAAHPEDLN